LSPSLGSSSSVFSPSLILSKISRAECLCKNSLLLPHLYEKVHRGHPASFLHKHSALEILERINDGEKTELEEPREGDKPLV